MTIDTIIKTMGLTHVSDGVYSSASGNQYSVGYLAACSAVGNTPDMISEMADALRSRVDEAAVSAVGAFLGKWPRSHWNRQGLDLFWANGGYAYDFRGQEMHEFLDRAAEILPAAVKCVADWEAANSAMWRKDEDA